MLVDIALLQEKNVLQPYEQLKLKYSVHRKTFFLWDWGLNSKLCPSKAGTLLLEPHLQLFC
jgi:hypothetical protein